MLIVYGIANCDTVKKTRKWLDAQGVEYSFHDYKKLGCDAQLAAELLANISLERLINTRGTTWRKLPDAEKDRLDETSALALIQRETSVIKRPILRAGQAWVVGYDEAAFSALVN